MASRKALFTTFGVVRSSIVGPLLKMPPKQATLGYVRNSQTTLGCVNSVIAARYLTNNLLNSKFFSQPNGSRAPAQQSKLASSSKSIGTDPPSSSSSKENEDADIKDEPSEIEVISKVEKEGEVDINEDMKPESGA